MPSVWKGVGDFFTGDGDSKKAGLVILIVVLVLAGGILTTAALIRRYAATEPLAVPGTLVGQGA